MVHIKVEISINKIDLVDNQNPKFRPHCLVCNTIFCVIYVFFLSVCGSNLINLVENFPVNYYRCGKVRNRITKNHAHISSIYFGFSFFVFDLCFFWHYYPKKVCAERNYCKNTPKYIQFLPSKLILNICINLNFIS